ncbi:inner membrane-spanning protein YciB [Rhodopseudomonas palustris]|uniref:Septation protein IspZ n=1 Tax=Rhodopseudomonas palustris (strain ATCC BAA-98 / CGA009) TaxID=258594 RepID=Q6N322_RHOPA|nr:septation protein IspZ [Rhodopseudomonas palustris]OPF92706.1 intracellular septation protein [Rhodopseudomonas palustris]PPQ41169.1 intracellular septation protein [Rhodopseudomonas palustris]QQM05430.1 intracellular septation protein A [Rhodopseudomonas palustris]RJF63195.1 intracellular septation protein [Rhodopseudomonas palustris]WAB76770.1 septation protein IspZ [Rhodopseudomonas palustris]
MKAVFAKLGSDFFSTIVFVVLYFSTGNVALATIVAVLGAVGQFIYAKIKGQRLDVMAYASVALVVVLGGATLLTNDPRFVLIKPSVGHIAVGLLMLRRDWMLRYVPPIVAETIPDYVRIAGYAWAALMLLLGTGVIAAAMTGDIKVWTFYVMVIAPAFKVAAFAGQYLVFRIAIRSRRRAAVATAEPAASTPVTAEP